MNHEGQICLQWKDALGAGWRTLWFSGIPLRQPVKIRIDFFPESLAQVVEQLIAEIERLANTLRGQASDRELLPELVETSEQDNLLEVVICDGQTKFALDPRINTALKATSHCAVLPMMPSDGAASSLPDALQRQNIAFWQSSIRPEALTVLACAGVTSFDRRVFISYRRVETAPMADQIFARLTKLNFQVFLDTVSIDPGVDFQAHLFEQLADKSMIVLLHSKTFSDSRWTMAEVDFAREHELSLLMLRLPDVNEKDNLAKRSRAGDVLRLEEKDVVASGQGYSLTQNALDLAIAQVTEQHDVELISRLASLRSRTLEALDRINVRHNVSLRDASVLANSDCGKTYSLFPTSRPPGTFELFDASSARDAGDHRIVVGRVSSLQKQRISQLDWIVDGRNVAYADVSQLDMIAHDIKRGRL